MNTIKPKIGLSTWIVLAVFLFCGIVFFLSPHRNLAMSIASFISILVLFVLLWSIDYSHLFIQKRKSQLILSGYFNFRKVVINFDGIAGFESCERIDQINGFHKQYQLVLKDGRKIFFSKFGYENNYDEVIQLCESEFTFLGESTIANSEFFKKLVSVIGLFSGIIALLVALLKILN